jgi:hypothetical protein
MPHSYRIPHERIGAYIEGGMTFIHVRNSGKRRKDPHNVMVDRENADF